MLTYIVIGAVPALMIAHFYLALLEQHLYSQTYAKHIAIEDFELIMQQAHQRGKWFNPIHIGLTLIVTTCLIFLWSYDPTIFEAYLGFALMIPCLGIANQITHILFYLYVNKHSEIASGKVVFKHYALQVLSMYRMLSFLLPFSFITAVYPSPFMFGCLAAPLFLALRYLLGARKS